MGKAFLLSHIYREKLYYKLVYADTLEKAKLKLKDELNILYLELHGWKNIEHNIASKTLL